MVSCIRTHPEIHVFFFMNTLYSCRDFMLKLYIHSHLLNLIQNSGAGSESIIMAGKNLP